MPIYEYECENCGYRFEKFQKMSDKPIEKCPKCGGRARRLFSKDVGLIFKGPGFYSTDYKRNKSKNRTNYDKKKPHVKPHSSDERE